MEFVLVLLKLITIPQQKLVNLAAQAVIPVLLQGVRNAVLV